jgi:hypothetical protein
MSFAIQDRRQWKGADLGNGDGGHRHLGRLGHVLGLLLLHGLLRSEVGDAEHDGDNLVVDLLGEGNVVSSLLVGDLVV